DPCLQPLAPDTGRLEHCGLPTPPSTFASAAAHNRIIRSSMTDASISNLARSDSQSALQVRRARGRNQNPPRARSCCALGMTQYGPDFPITWQKALAFG